MIAVHIRFKAQPKFSMNSAVSAFSRIDINNAEAGALSTFDVSHLFQ